MKKSHVAGERLEAFVVGELDQQQMAEIKQHLSHCKPCQSECAKIKKENENYKFLLSDENNFASKEINQKLAKQFSARIQSERNVIVLTSWEDRVLGSGRFWATIAAFIAVGLFLPYWSPSNSGLGIPESNQGSQFIARENPHRNQPQSTESLNPIEEIRLRNEIVSFSQQSKGTTKINLALALKERKECLKSL